MYSSINIRRMTLEIQNYLHLTPELKVYGKRSDLICKDLLQKIKEQHLTNSLYKPYHYMVRFGPRIKEIMEVSDALKIENILDGLYTDAEYFVIPRTNNLKVKVVKNIDNDLAYLFGIMLGDGSLSKNHNHIVVSLNKNEKVYAERIANLIKFYFSVTPRIMEFGKCLGIFVRNKVIHTFLTKVIGLPSGKRGNFGIPRIIAQEPELVREFVGGFFDTDGTIYAKRGRNALYVRFSQKSEQILLEIKEFLNTLGIRAVSEFDNRTGVKHLAIYSQESVMKFCRLIKSRHPHKSNIMNSCLHAPITNLVGKV